MLTANVDFHAPILITQIFCLWNFGGSEAMSRGQTFQRSASARERALRRRRLVVLAIVLIALCAITLASADQSGGHGRAGGEIARHQVH